ncbi:MAG TPA: AAA family ATPase, partial [Sphingomicrobium sp.]|nr:AAA family ATPase [Sphingomicrobium sp.]
MAVTRLSLTDFRSYAAALIEPGPGFVLLSGDNGAGKTNCLEAVSLLTPGRGLRGAPLADMARTGGPGGFGVAARLGETDIGTGTLATAPERRQVRINGAPAAVNSLSEWLSVLWLTPAMDRLFADSAGARRRFLDRLVLALEPGHAHHSARYEAAMRARNKLLAEPDAADPAWLAALEAGMAEHGAAVAAALRDQLGMGEHQAEQKRLLLAGRAQRRRHRLGAVGDEEVLAVRAARCPPGGRIAAATGLEQGGEVAVRAAFERQLGDREIALGRVREPLVERGHRARP